MVFTFSVSERLIFSNPGISNFCKSFLYLKAIADKDEQLRQEIRAGVQTENMLDENSRYFFRRDWFDLEDNVLPKRNIHQEWKEFLNFHAEKVAEWYSALKQQRPFYTAVDIF